jgi:hypothetical protein
MQTITQQFEQNSKRANRRPSYNMNIDWTNTSQPINEIRRIKLLEIERAMAEPQGGIQTAVADITLNNKDNRYTPR